MGGLQSSDLIIVAGRPAWQDRARHQHRYNVAKAHRAEVQADGTMKSINGGIRRLLLLRNVGPRTLATRILAEADQVSRRARSGAAALPKPTSRKIRDYSIELQSLPLYVDENRRPCRFRN